MAAPPPSRLDANQVLQGSFDEAEGRLRTTSNATIVNADIDVALDATEDSVQSWIVDEAGQPFTNANPLPVTVNSITGTVVLPTGASTAALQTTGNTTLTNINNKLANNYGASTTGLRTASQIGNATGAADFGLGTITGQTLRTAANSIGTDPNDAFVLNKESGVVNSNSTSTPLLAGGTFTGDWVDASQYSCISWTVNSNVDSAVQGMRIQFSHDGVNIIRQAATNLVGSANGVFFSFPVQAKYFRIFYQNGAVDQTNFYLDTQLHEEYNGLAAIPLNTALTDVSTATTVKAIIAGKGIDGVYVNQRASGVSTLNSTTTPLGPAATFVGTFEDVVGFATIAITVFSNVDSTIDGLIAEFSSDGINVDHADYYTVPAGEGTQFTFGVLAKYFRIRFINGGSPQVTFRLSTLYNLSDVKSSSIRIDDSITGQNDAELVKSVATGKNPDGVFVNSRVQGTEATNSYYTPLGANAIYRGEWVRWADSYLTITSTVSSDVLGTLYIDASDVLNPSNGTDVDVTFSAVSVFDPAEVPALRRNTPLQSLWIRHRYINGPAGQSFFNLAALFTTGDPGSAYIPANEQPANAGLAAVTRAIVSIPNAAGNAYQDVPVDPITGDPTITVQTIRDDILLKPMNSVQVEQGVVSISPVRIDSSPLLNRRKVFISNDGLTNCSIGFDSGITYNSGSFVLKAGKERELDVGASVELWAVAENTGGASTVLTRTGTITGGTATNTGNTLLSDDIYANITAAAQTATVTGFTAGTANPIVSVKLGIEGKKQSGQFETVTFQELQSGATAGAGTVASASLAGGLQQLYIAFVTRNDNVGTVTQVLGGSKTFTAALQNVTSGNRRIDIWYAYGTFTAGAVTASLLNSTNAHISVSRYTNVDPTTPIQTIASSSGTGTAVTGPSIAGTIKGYSILGVTHTAASGTPGVGYTEGTDATNGAGGNVDSIYTERKPLVATATETATATLASSVPWAAIGLTLNPVSAIDPRITLSYELSAVPGATSGITTVSNTTDTSALVDVTGDRVWVAADIPNVTVIATGTTVGSASADIDQLYLEIVDTTGNSTRLSVLQTGRSF